MDKKRITVYLNQDVHKYASAYVKLALGKSLSSYINEHLWELVKDEYGELPKAHKYIKELTVDEFEKLLKEYGLEK